MATKMRASRFPVFLLGLAVAAVVSACGAGAAGPAVQEPASGGEQAEGSLGVIAYVDDRGCITRVDAATGAPVAAPFCAASKAGITAVTWLDAGSAAYATAESRALGWQVVDFATGKSATMLMADAPRVFLIPPQAYSPRGEELQIDDGGVVTREDPAAAVRIFPPPSHSPDSATRVLTWSPDADWVLLSTSTDKELWVVGRNGELPHRVAPKSRGIASWFMPEAGAMPHADLTCSVTTAASYSCQPALRAPLDGTVATGAAAGAALDFSWSACPGATGYEFVVFAEDSVEPSVHRVTAGTFSHPLVSGLPSGALRWKVRALIGPTPAPWSAERVVTIAGATR